MTPLVPTPADIAQAEAWFIEADGQHDGPVNAYLAGVLAERARIVAELQERITRYRERGFDSRSDVVLELTARISAFRRGPQQ